MMQEDSDSSEDMGCYACGILFDTDIYVTGIAVGEIYQFCSKACLNSGNKYEQKKECNELEAPVRGTCDGKVIDGIARFDIHGVVHLTFAHPNNLTATIIVPKTFLKHVSETYQ